METTFSSTRDAKMAALIFPFSSPLSSDQPVLYAESPQQTLLHLQQLLIIFFLAEIII